MGTIEKMVNLQVIDDRWKEHLREMDDLREGIHLRAYGQKDPLLEYKSEAFRMFMELLDMLNAAIVAGVFKLFPAQAQQEPLRAGLRAPRREQLRTTHESSSGMGFQGSREPVPGQARPPEEAAAARAGKPQPMQVGEKIGRNDPCPCGSGKKFKQCHGR
jgi:preprotein translocase subunit SecA